MGLIATFKQMQIGLANPAASAEEDYLQLGAAVACGSVRPLFCSSTAGLMTNHHAAPLLFGKSFTFARYSFQRYF